MTRDRYIAPGNGDDSGSTRYRRWLPMLASLQHELAAGMHAYASLGGGMETPTFNEISYRPGGLPGLNFDLQPAKSTSVELGLRQRIASEALRGSGLRRCSTPAPRTRIVTATNTGGRSTFRNAGRTRRQGAEFASQLHLSPQWELSGALTVLDVGLRDGFCNAAGANCVPAGKRIAGTARAQATLGLDWRPRRLAHRSAVAASAPLRPTMPTACRPPATAACWP